MAREITEYDRARGRRLKQIREALKLSQAAVVERLNEAADALGLPARYEYYTVSRMEKGSITFEDATVWLSIDPARKGREPLRWDWFVVGDTRVTRRVNVASRQTGT